MEATKVAIVVLAPFACLVAFVVLQPPAMADVNPTVLPDAYSWSEVSREQSIGGGVLFWAPNGSLAVWGSGLKLEGYYGFAYNGDLNSTIPRLLDENLTDLGGFLAAPVNFRCAEFTPNGSWFVAIYDLPPSMPFAYGSPEFNNTTIHYEIWRTTDWSVVEDRVLATQGSVWQPGTPRTLPFQFSISPLGDRILFWDDEINLNASNRSRLEVRTFPQLQEIVNISYAYPVWQARWSPNGGRIAAALGAYQNGGQVVVANASTLGATASLNELNTSFSDLSWSADGSLLSVKGSTWAHYVSGPCPLGWKLAAVSARVYPAANLSSPRIMWFHSAAPNCGLPDGWFIGQNSSLSLAFHPTAGYLLVSQAQNLSVWNTTFWDVVLSANLSTQSNPDDQACWAGGTLSFSFVSFGFRAPVPPSGWEFEVPVDRALYRASPHLPTASLVVSAPNGTADLYPGLPYADATFSLVLDSPARAYSRVTISAVGAGAVVSLSIGIPGGDVFQEGGGGFVALVGFSILRGWDGTGLSVRPELLASWNVSIDGAWILSANAILWNGTTAPASITGNLSTHLEVELLGPLGVEDAARGPLAAGALENETPTITFSWPTARFVFEQAPLDPTGLRVGVDGGAGPSQWQDLASSMAAGLTRAFGFSNDTVLLSLRLSNAQSTVLDRSNLSIWLRIDRFGPIVRFEDLSDGAWIANSSLPVRFNVSSAQSGAALAGAGGSMSQPGGIGWFDVQDAVAVGGVSSEFLTEFLVTLAVPPGASGEIAVRVFAQDEVGNLGEAVLHLNLDREPPGLSFQSWPQWINKSTYEFRWSCTDSGVGTASASNRVTYMASPASTPIEALGVPNGLPASLSFLAEVQMTEGRDGSVRFSCTDALGNQNLSAPIGVRVDRTSPVIASTVPDASTTLDGAQQNLSFRLLEDGSGISTSSMWAELSVDGGSSYRRVNASNLTQVSPGRFDVTFSLVLSEGSANRLRLGGADLAGNAPPPTTLSISVNQAPTLTIAWPVDGTAVPAGPIDARATVVDPDGDRVTVQWLSGDDGRLLAMGPNATFSLGPGTQTIVVLVDDGHGHRVRAQASVVGTEVSARNADVPWLALLALAALGSGVLLAFGWRRRSAKEP
jgi:hypothetical protein